MSLKEVLWSTYPLTPILLLAICAFGLYRRGQDHDREMQGFLVFLIVVILGLIAVVSLIEWMQRG